MTHSVRLSTHARRSYSRLARADRRLFSRVDRALERLATNPDAGKQLRGPLHGRRSLRVGAVRIIYRVDGDRLLVLILEIAQRQSVYR